MEREEEREREREREREEGEEGERERVNEQLEKGGMYPVECQFARFNYCTIYNPSYSWHSKGLTLSEYGAQPHALFSR